MRCFILEMVILKISGQDPNFGAQVMWTDSIDFQRSLQPFWCACVCVLLSPSSEAPLPGMPLRSRQELSLLDVLRVVDAKEEVTTKRSVHGDVIWCESRHVARVPVHKLLNVRKRIYRNIIESVLIVPPPESTSLCDLGFPVNVKKRETSLTYRIWGNFLLISVSCQRYENRQYNIFNPSSKA